MRDPPAVVVLRRSIIAYRTLLLTPRILLPLPILPTVPLIFIPIFPLLLLWARHWVGKSG